MIEKTSNKKHTLCNILLVYNHFFHFCSNIELVR